MRLALWFAHSAGTTAKGSYPFLNLFILFGGRSAKDEAIHSPVAIAVVLLVVGMSPTVLDALRLWALTDMQERGWVFQGGTSPGTWYVELVDVYSSTFFRI